MRAQVQHYAAVSRCFAAEAAAEQQKPSSKGRAGNAPATASPPPTVAKNGDLDWDHMVRPAGQMREVQEGQMKNMAPVSSRVLSSSAEIQCRWTVSLEAVTENVTLTGTSRRALADDLMAMAANCSVLYNY